MSEAFLVLFSEIVFTFKWKRGQGQIKNKVNATIFSSKS